MSTLKTVANGPVVRCCCLFPTHWRRRSLFCVCTDAHTCGVCGLFASKLYPIKKNFEDCWLDLGSPLNWMICGLPMYKRFISDFNVFMIPIWDLIAGHFNLIMFFLSCLQNHVF